MPPPRQVFVAVVGTGGVGRCFLAQLSALASRLSQNAPSPIYLSLIFLSRSSKALYNPTYRSLPLSTWESDLDGSSQQVLTPTQIAEYLASAPSRVVLVDNTSDQALADAYPLFLRRGISIVTPNKKAFSGSLDLWRAIYAAAANGRETAAGGSGASAGGGSSTSAGSTMAPSGPAAAGSTGFVFHESTVGAGLPVLSTLADLVDTGDRVRRIEGVFSGTLSFLFNGFMPVGGGTGGSGGSSFSAEVKKAKELGYTEPDPRDDLNGLDVARKVTILARLAGLPVAAPPAAFPVQSLVPAELEGVASGDEFLARLGEFDGAMDKVRKDAAQKGKVVRYVGSVDVENNELKVGLETFDPSHPIAALKGSDNVIAFYTERYGANPLIVQGAGAGGEVTAMGVTGDLIKVLRLLH
ncbi:homoserine dehydrogenase-domain-containing protein [Lineolata rhizophorae]|uniref:Homoserine dehydrogenase n=1 Tax=Lineolata rhizophorae TaxID=578093 RepID=A0A6A6P1M0_9PEZI|nr:homoserine dehydrogenase-domain-containing protein [Lineolata rhizophorae]